MATDVCIPYGYGYKGGYTNGIAGLYRGTLYSPAAALVGEPAVLQPVG